MLACLCHSGHRSFLHRGTSCRFEREDGRGSPTALAEGREGGEALAGAAEPCLLPRASGSWAWAPGAEAASPAPADRNPQLIPSASGHSAQEVIPCLGPSWSLPFSCRFREPPAITGLVAGQGDLGRVCPLGAPWPPPPHPPLVLPRSSGQPGRFEQALPFPELP